VLVVVVEVVLLLPMLPAVAEVVVLMPNLQLL
jgi:hypothetical protein